MAGIDGSKRHVVFEAEAYDELAIELAGVEANADVLAMLAQSGDIDTLNKRSLSRVLLELHERLAKLRAGLERARHAAEGGDHHG